MTGWFKRYFPDNLSFVVVETLVCPLQKSHLISFVFYPILFNSIVYAAYFLYVIS